MTLEREHRRPGVIESCISNWRVAGRTDPYTHFVVCPTCGGCVLFILQELEERRARGQNTSVYCPMKGGRKPEHWHPAFPPEPIYMIDYKADLAPGARDYLVQVLRDVAEKEQTVLGVTQKESPQKS